MNEKTNGKENHHDRPQEFPTPTLQGTLGCITGILALTITSPIWYILVYKILVKVDATPMMWVLYWIYTPIGIVISIINNSVLKALNAKKK